MQIFTKTLYAMVVFGKFRWPVLLDGVNITIDFRTVRPLKEYFILLVVQSLASLNSPQEANLNKTLGKVSTVFIN